jgi:hypothetical protein
MEGLKELFMAELARLINDGKATVVFFDAEGNWIQYAFQI